MKKSRAAALTAQAAQSTANTQGDILAQLAEIKGMLLEVMNTQSLILGAEPGLHVGPVSEEDAAKITLTVLPEEQATPAKPPKHSKGKAAPE